MLWQGKRDSMKVKTIERFHVGDIIEVTGVSQRVNQRYIGVVLWSNETEVGVVALKQRQISAWIVSRNQVVGRYYKTLKDIGEDEGWRIV